METAPESESTRARAWDYLRFKVPPPVAFIMLTGVGIGLQLTLPMRLLARVKLARTTGFVVVALGISLMATTIRTLKRANTDERCLRPTTTIVQHGPYKRSRNPMYMGVILCMIGLSFAINTIWVLMLAPVLFLFLNFLVIPSEEQYLVDNFGEEYLAYKLRVRRWM